MFGKPVMVRKRHGWKRPCGGNMLEVDAVNIQHPGKMPPMERKGKKGENTSSVHEVVLYVGIFVSQQGDVEPVPAMCGVGKRKAQTH